MKIAKTGAFIDIFTCCWLRVMVKMWGPVLGPWDPWSLALLGDLLYCLKH